jgi:hypothetical protein
MISDQHQNLEKMKTITDAINQIIKKFEKGEHMTVP